MSVLAVVEPQEIRQLTEASTQSNRCLPLNLIKEEIDVLPSPRCCLLDREQICPWLLPARAGDVGEGDMQWETAVVEGSGHQRATG